MCLPCECAMCDGVRVLWVNIFLTICLHVEHGHTNWPTGRCNWRQPNRGERAFPPPPLQTHSLVLPRCCQPAGSHCYLISNAGFVFALPTGNNFSFNSSNAQTEPNQTEPNRFNRFAPVALANHRARSGHRYIYMCICVYTYLLLWGYAEGVCCTCRQPFINKYCTFKFSIWRPISDKGIRHNNNWECSLICPEISIVHWCRVWFLVLNCACVCMCVCGGGGGLSKGCS